MTTDEDMIIERFNLFIKRWCKDNYPHLIDSDENDGEDFRLTVSECCNDIKREERLRTLAEIKREWEKLMKQLYTEIGQHKDADKVETLYHLHNYKMIREFEKVFEGNNVNLR